MTRANSLRTIEFRDEPAPLLGSGNVARIAGTRVRLGGIEFDAVTEQQCIQHVISRASAGVGGWIVTPNLHFASQARRDAEVRRLIASADVCVADGMPLVWASRLGGQMLPERVAGSSLITTLTGAAANAGLSVFMLGGNPGAAAGAAEVLQTQFPNLDVAGVLCPPMGFDSDAQEMARIEQALLEAKPHIAYVGLGCPKQERLIERLRPLLPGTWFLGIGYSFSFVSGEARRAPRWMQRTGMEWAHRLASEPRRLARRYLVECPPALAVMTGGALAERVRSRRPTGPTSPAPAA